MEDILDDLESPDALLLSQIVSRARTLGHHEFAEWVKDGNHSRQTALMLEDCGYRRLSNPLDKRGRWMIGGQRVGGVYVRKNMMDREASRLLKPSRMCRYGHGGRIGRIFSFPSSSLACVRAYYCGVLLGKSKGYHTGKSAQSTQSAQPRTTSLARPLPTVMPGGAAGRCGTLDQFHPAALADRHAKVLAGGV